MVILIIVLVWGTLIFLIATKRISGYALLRSFYNSLVSLFWSAVGVGVLFTAEGAAKLLGLAALGYGLYGIFTQLDWHQVWLGAPDSEIAKQSSSAGSGATRYAQRPALDKAQTESDPTPASHNRRPLLPDTCLSEGEAFPLRTVAPHAVVGALGDHLENQSNGGLVIDWREATSLPQQTLLQISNVLTRMALDGTATRIVGHRVPEDAREAFATAAADKGLFFESSPSCFEMRKVQEGDPWHGADAQVATEEAPHPCLAYENNVDLGPAAPHTFVGLLRSAFDSAAGSDLCVNFVGVDALDHTYERVLANIVTGSVADGNARHVFLHEPPASTAAAVRDMALDRGLDDLLIGRCVRISTTTALTGESAIGRPDITIDAEGLDDLGNLPADLNRNAPTLQHRLRVTALGATANSPPSLSSNEITVERVSGAASPISLDDDPNGEDARQLPSDDRAAEGARLALSHVDGCPSCETRLVPGSKFCRICGVELTPTDLGQQQAKFCARCGRQYSGDQQFCTECGNPRPSRPVDRRRQAGDSEREPTGVEAESSTLPLSDHLGADPGLLKQRAAPTEEAMPLDAVTGAAVVDAPALASDPHGQSDQRVNNDIASTTGGSVRQGAAESNEPTTADPTPAQEPADESSKLPEPAPENEGPTTPAEHQPPAAKTTVGPVEAGTTGICPKCGQELPDSAWFCSHCGTRTDRA